MSKYFNTILLALFLVFIGVISCKKDDPTPNGESPNSPVVFDDTPYDFTYGSNMSNPELPADNPLTIAKVALGRKLFYENLLSGDGTMNCASCHVQEDGFSDKNQFSTGIAGLQGGRQAMPVINLAWHSNQFFWDGRADKLRDQAIKPIQDPLEMNETMENVRAKLKASALYPDLFVQAFENGEISDTNIALALEAFMFSVVSSDSKYDRFLRGEATLTASEERGRELYFAEYNPAFPDLSGADCAHCHGGSNLENDEYMNNGLDDEASISDEGRSEVTGDPADRGKFKVFSLRNIAVTGPYMHDGRFTTLEEVVDHYNEGIQTSNSLDPALANTQSTGLMLDAQDKIDLVNFLKTFTDDTFLTNPAYSNPN